MRSDASVEEFRAAAESAEKEGIAFDYTNYVHSVPVDKHDILMIPPGTVHGSREGLVVLEISSTTYRYTFKIYDHLRPDLQGVMRPIHIEHAFKVLNKKRRGNWVDRHLKPKPSFVASGNGWTEYLIATSRDFFHEVFRVEVEGEVKFETEGRFHILTLVDGESVILISGKSRQKMNYSETVTVPACAGSYTIETGSGEKCNCEGPLEVNSHIILALDVGGTTVKSALCDLHGQLVSGVNITSVDSRGSRSVILKRFSEILTGLVAQSNKVNLEPVGLAVAFPGPFDYEKGICLIKGVNKYEALYGMDLSGFFRNEVTVTELFPVIFDADSWAFTRGQYLKGAAIGARRIIGITIGTGLGSAFMEEGRIVQNERGIPPYGWIGNLPFGKGILDDRVSRRGILARYREISDSLQVDLDVKDLYNLAVIGHCRMKLFCETGSLLAEAPYPLSRSSIRM